MTELPPSRRSRNAKQGPTVSSSELLRELLESLPPHSPEAEMSLLGSLILEPSMVAEVLMTIPSPDAFYSETHGAIYKAMLELYDMHEGWDTVQLLELLRDRHLLEPVGGVEYITQLAESVPSAVNAPHYARIIASKARLRALIDSSWKIIYDAHNIGELGPNGVDTLLDRAEAEIFEISHQTSTNDIHTLAEVLQIEIDRIDALEGKGLTGIPTGYPDLDHKLSGLQPGEMLILAARPSMGKTALALNLAEQIAFGGATPWSKPLGPPVATAIFSLEMSRGSLAQRLLSSRSGIDLHHLRTGQVGMDEWQRLNAACGELSESPLYIDDTPSLTVLQLRARARRLVSQYGVKVILIDYLQLLTSPSAAKESRQVEVATISRGIKSLARELRVPIVCLAQLNRGTEHREGNRPRMADLRESGSIEQDADVVMLLHREEYYHQNDKDWLNDPDNEDKIGLAELIIAKQRNGPTGVVEFTWDKKTTRFKSREKSHHASYVDEAAGASFSNNGAGGFATTYDSPSQAAGFVEPGIQPPQPPATPADTGYQGFAPGNKTGPVENFRDGGGPDAFDDDDVPF